MGLHNRIKLPPKYSSENGENYLKVTTWLQIIQEKELSEYYMFTMLPDSSQQLENFHGTLLVEKYFEGKVAQMKIDDKIINERKHRTISNKKTNNVSVNPNWNETDGYTLGFSHNHPSGFAPSPSDVFNTSLNILDMVHNNNILNNELVNYINNFTSIIVSKGVVYTISIKHGIGYMAVKDSGFHKPTDNGIYKRYFNDYILENNLDPELIADKQKAGEYAILKLYGDIINITKHKIGEESNSHILKIDKTTKKIKEEKLC